MSLVSVWDELWGLVADDPTYPDSAPVAALTEVRRVYRGEPVKGYELSGTWLSVTPAAVRADYYDYWLRVYSVIVERPLDNQQAVATTVDQLELLLDGQNRFERDDWEIGVTEALGDWTAAIQLSGPRE